MLSLTPSQHALLDKAFTYSESAVLFNQVENELLEWKQKNNSKIAFDLTNMMLDRMEQRLSPSDFPSLRRDVFEDGSNKFTGEFRDKALVECTHAMLSVSHEAKFIDRIRFCLLAFELFMYYNMVGFSGQYLNTGLLRQFKGYQDKPASIIND